MAARLATTDIERHLAGVPDSLAQAVASAPERFAAGTLTEADVEALERQAAHWREGGAALREHLSTIENRPEDLPVIAGAVALVEADLARIVAGRPAVLERLRDMSIPRGPVSTEGLKRLRGLSERLIAVAETDYHERLAFADFLRAQRTKLEGARRPFRADPMTDPDAFVDEIMERFPVIMAHLAR